MKQKIKERSLKRIFVLVRDKKINLDQLIYIWANRKLKNLHNEIKSLQENPREYFGNSCNVSGGFVNEMIMMLSDGDIDEILKNNKQDDEGKAILSKIWSFI